MPHVHRTKSYSFVNIILCAALLLQNFSIIARIRIHDEKKQDHEEALRKGTALSDGPIPLQNESCPTLYAGNFYDGRKEEDDDREGCSIATDTKLDGHVWTLKRDMQAYDFQGHNIITHDDIDYYPQSSILQNASSLKTWDENTHNPSGNQNTQYNQTQDQVPAPMADTAPLDEELLEKVLHHCPEKIKNIITTIRSPNAHREFPKKLLLIGPPGTGKTTLGKAIAAQAGLPFFGFSGAGISNAYKNSGSVNLERIFKMAVESSPCILMIDELSELFKQHKNEHDTDSGTLTRLWQLLDQISDHPILFIGTLNSAKDAPPQIKNRFKRFIVEVPLPNPQQRRQLILYHVKQCDEDIRFEKGALNALVDKTKSFAHRDLNDIVATIIEHADMRNEYDDDLTITMDDISYALGDFKNNDSLLEGSWYERWEKPVKEWGPLTVSIISGIAIGGYGLYHTCSAYRETTLHQRKMEERDLLFREKSYGLQIKEFDLRIKGHEYTVAINNATFEFQQECHKQTHELNKNQAWWNWLYGGIGAICSIVHAGVAIGGAFCGMPIPPPAPKIG